MASYTFPTSLIWTPDAYNKPSNPLEIQTGFNGIDAYFKIIIYVDLSDVTNLEQFASVSISQQVGYFRINSIGVDFPLINSGVTSGIMRAQTDEITINSNQIITAGTVCFAYADSGGSATPIIFTYIPVEGSPYNIFGKGRYTYTTPDFVNFTIEYRGTDIPILFYDNEEQTPVSEDFTSKTYNAPSGSLTSILKVYSYPGYALNPFAVNIVGDTPSIITDFGSYGVTVETVFLTYSNFYTGGSVYYSMEAVDQVDQGGQNYGQVVIPLVNEECIDPSVFTGTDSEEGGTSRSYFNSANYSYISSSTDVNLVTPAVFDDFPPIYQFQQATPNNLLATTNPDDPGSSDVNIIIYIISHSASYKHTLVYSIGNTAYPTWNVLTPIIDGVQYPDLPNDGIGINKNGVQGTVYAYYVNLNTFTGPTITTPVTLRFGVIPNGYDVITGFDNTLVTKADGANDAYLISSSGNVNGSIDLSCVNSTQARIGFFTTNIDVCLPGPDRGGAHCGYLPNTSHLNYIPVVGTRTVETVDYNALLGMLYLTEDLEFGGVNGFSEVPGYSDFDFNDMSFYVSTSFGSSYGPTTLYKFVSG